MQSANASITYNVVDGPTLDLAVFKTNHHDHDIDYNNIPNTIHYARCGS